MSKLYSLLYCPFKELKIIGRVNFVFVVSMTSGNR